MKKQSRFEPRTEFEANEKGVLYTMEQADGAIPNSTLVKKVAGEADDTHAIGALATVLGSIGPFTVPGGPPVEYGYFVSWADMPDVPVFVTGRKIAKADGP